jgi:choline kinase
MKAVILAAGMGSRLAPLTNDRPKPMVDVGGKPLLFRTLDRLAEAGLSGPDVVIVTGYREDVIRARLAEAGCRATLVTNTRHDDWNNWYSLYCAREHLMDGFLLVDGDVLFDSVVLPRMLSTRGPAAMSIDVRPDLDEETMKVIAPGAERRIRAVSKKLPPEDSLGEYIGVTRVDADATRLVFDELARFEAEALTNEYYEHAIHRLASRGELTVFACDVGDCVTIEIDDAQDLARAEALLEKERVVA